MLIRREGPSVNHGLRNGYEHDRLPNGSTGPPRSHPALYPPPSYHPDASPPLVSIGGQPSKRSPSSLPDLLDPPDYAHHRDPPHTALNRAHRQLISCYPCRDRKLKCDGEKPCCQCVRRGPDVGCDYAERVRRRGKGRKRRHLEDGGCKAEVMSSDSQEGLELGGEVHGMAIRDHQVTAGESARRIWSEDTLGEIKEEL